MPLGKSLILAKFQPVCTVYPIPALKELSPEGKKDVKETEAKLSSSGHMRFQYLPLAFPTVSHGQDGPFQAGTVPGLKYNVALCPEEYLYTTEAHV